MADEPTLRTHDLVYWAAELRAGRPEAAEPTFRKIMARVERLTRAMIRKFPRVERFAEVDDVVQNATLRLLRAMREIRPDSTREFYAFVNTLIRRELLDLCRRFYGPAGAGSNLADVPVGHGEGEFVPPDAAASDDLELPAAFHVALERLPAEEREVIGLTYYHGWTQEKIAVLFGVSVRTVQRWLTSGVQRLRETIGGDGR